MKLAATLARSLQADMQAELRDIERAVTTGTREAGRALRTELGRQVRAPAPSRLELRWGVRLEVVARERQLLGARVDYSNRFSDRI